MEDEENKKRRRPVDESILGESPKKPRVEETVPGVVNKVPSVASVVKTSPGVEKKTVSEIKVERTMSTNSVEPPAFISENRSYAEYKADLKMWSRITTLDKKVQAEMVVYRLTGHSSRIKEKIMTQIGKELENNDVGIEVLIKFLDGIFEKEDMMDVWDKYSDFAEKKRHPGQDVGEFIADWENTWHKAKAAGCEFGDTILGFKLLKDVNLTKEEVDLVLTGVDFPTAKTNKNLRTQVEVAIQKFHGRKALGAESNATRVKEQEVLITQMETVLIAKGWKKPGVGKKRSRSVSPAAPGGGAGGGGSYKGRKNKLGSDFKVMKCHKCRCEHKESCNCACNYHFANSCTNTKPKTANVPKQDMTLYVKTNVQQTETPCVMQIEEADEACDELVLVVNETLEELEGDGEIGGGPLCNKLREVPHLHQPLG